ncbi:hypothetical protein [Belnapia sp. F-4-1]|nr:hypothetical protein [Belnapia sp. F-4-1]
MRGLVLLALLLLAACQQDGASGPYVGGSVGTNLRGDQRLR